MSGFLIVAVFTGKTQNGLTLDAGSGVVVHDIALEETEENYRRNYGKDSSPQLILGLRLT